MYSTTTFMKDPTREKNCFEEHNLLAILLVKSQERLDIQRGNGGLWWPEKASKVGWHTLLLLLLSDRRSWLGCLSGDEVAGDDGVVLVDRLAAA